MDRFDVLAYISKRKKAFMSSGLEEKEALIEAEKVTSKEYHISLRDIKRLVGDLTSHQA